VTPIGERYICRSMVYLARVAICRDAEGRTWFCVERYTPAGKGSWDPEVEVTPKSPMWIAIEVATGVRDADGALVVLNPEQGNG
jgi:hypothetical protein